MGHGARADYGANSHLGTGPRPLAALPSNNKLDRCAHIGPAEHHPDSRKSERISALTNISSLNSENKSALPPAAWLARLLNGVGQRLHARTDAMARQHGWEVTQSNGGLRRRYRDPRFGSLVRCPSC